MPTFDCTPFRQGMNHTLAEYIDGVAPEEVTFRFDLCRSHPSQRNRPGGKRWPASARRTGSPQKAVGV